MSEFDTGINTTDVFTRPLAPWDDQLTSPTISSSWEDLKDPTIQMKPGGVGLGNLHRTGTNYKPNVNASSSSMPPTTPPAETVRRNILQTPAFKSAIAALGQKPPRMPSRDRQREKIAEGTSWGTEALSKTPFWQTNEQPPKPQQEQQEVVKENVLATFDISFVSDSEMGISITPSSISTAFQSIDMTLEKSNDSSTISTQPQPTATTSTTSFASSGLGGSETSMWATIREEELKKAEAAKATKWNVKAEAFQFTTLEKPVTPIFEFPKPSEEPEAPFFTFTGKKETEPPLFDFSTALNISKCTNEEESSKQDAFPPTSSEFTFSLPVAKKVVIKSPNKKPNPEAPEFTPTTIGSPSSVKTTAWNPKVTEFIPSKMNNNDENTEYIPEPPSFVSLTKPTKVTIKPPPKEEKGEEELIVVKEEEVKEEAVYNDLESQSQPETTRGLQEPIPLIQMNISFAPGVTSTLLVFENDVPKHIVSEFCRKHDLTMTQKAQNAFIDTLVKLKQAKLESLSK